MELNSARQAPGSELQDKNLLGEIMRWADAEGLAAHLKVSVPTIRRLTKAGKLPYHRVGSRLIRYDPREVETALKEEQRL